MNRLSQRSQNVLLVLLCAIIAYTSLLFCTRSSFLYPINDWTDANIFLSIAKGMNNGMVLYRDLFDHKGPLLFALYMPAALISSSSFLGVFLLEIIAATFFLYFCYQILILLRAGSLSVFALPMISMVVYSSKNFQAGGTAEEWMLPILAFALYDGIRFFAQKKTMSNRRLILHGFLLGCVFWVKYTLIGLQLMLCVFAVFPALLSKEGKEGFKRMGMLLLGFFLSTIPWLLYFGLNHAMGDWFTVYFYDNLFHYGDQPTTLLSRLQGLWHAIAEWVMLNPLSACFVLIGFSWVCTQKKERLFVLTSGIALLFLLFIGGVVHYYTSLPLSIFSVIGCVPFCQLAEKIVDSIHSRLSPALLKFSGSSFLRVTSVICLIVVCSLGCYKLSENVKLSYRQLKSETMQYQLAEIITQYDHPTLLNYGFMDAGFFTACDIVPTVKHFYHGNTFVSEVSAEQNRYIAEGLCDFVITNGEGPAHIHDLYVEVAHAKGPLWVWFTDIRLYQKKSMLVP